MHEYEGDSGLMSPRHFSNGGRRVIDNLSLLLKGKELHSLCRPRMGDVRARVVVR